MRKSLDGVWELEDDSPQAVRCVEETPRAAYTNDDLEAILTRVYLARALACMQPTVQVEIHIDIFISIWRGISDEGTSHVYRELVRHVK